MRIPIKSLLMGVAVFLLLTLITTLLFQLPTEIKQTPWGMMLLSTLNATVYPICGFVAAYSARHNGIVVGATVGAVIMMGILIMILIPNGWHNDEMIHFIGQLIQASLSGALGGAAGELIAMKRRY